MPLDLMEKIAHSAVYKNNALVFIVEDDAQDGGDHVDSHRSPAYVGGAYVRNQVVSTAYNTLDLLRPMEEVFGPGADEPERCAGDTHDRHLPHCAEPGLDLYRHSTVDSLPHESARASARATLHQPDAEIGVLGTSHERPGFSDADQIDGAVFQLNALEGDDGRQAVSGSTDRH